jgi:hypothetical protein
MPMRTLLDLAAVEPGLVEGATNHALGRGLVKLPRLMRYVDEVASQGRPGVKRMRAVKGMRFDLAYPEVPLDIEADSRLWHSTPADRRRDAARDAATAALGWAVERVTWLQIEEEPGAVAARIGRWLQMAQQAA